MSNYSRKSVLLIIAFIVALLFSTLIGFAMLNSNGKTSSELVLVSFLISFISSLILLLFVNVYVFKKINQLLVTVRDFRLQSDKPSSNINYTSNELSNLNSEIVAWAEDRKNEIERLKKLEVYRREFLGNVSHE